MAGDWAVHSGDGQLTLRLPDGFATDLDLHTGDGDIDLDFPVTVTRIRSENGLKAQLNGGGPRLTVRSGDGSIRIKRF